MLASHYAEGKFLPFLPVLLLAGCTTGHFTRLTRNASRAMLADCIRDERRRLIPAAIAGVGTALAQGVCVGEWPDIIHCVRSRW
jgi:hypothetical protein